MRRDKGIGRVFWFPLAREVAKPREGTKAQSADNRMHMRAKTMNSLQLWPPALR